MSEIKPRDIEALLATFEASEWSEMRLRIEGLDLFVSKTPGATPALSSEAAPPAAAPRAAATAPAVVKAATPAHWLTVKAPNLGTFYRAPKPGAPPYVQVGQQVDHTTELCLIEVMKLFTSVYAGVSGVVREVCVADGDLVEFDTALFLIEPDA